MLKKVALALLGALVLFAGFVATRPADFRVERSVTLKVPPAAAYALVADFHQWPRWSPWEELDPKQVHAYEGAASGVGAITSWTSEGQAGAGRMTILKAEQNAAVDIKLEFIKPFPGTNEAGFTFAPVDGGTKATWYMVGHNTFMMKAFHVFFDMDKALGGDFTKGLTKLGAAAEADLKKQAEAAAAEKAKADAEAAAQAAAPAGDAGTP